jgi:hypothetical protein
MGKFLLKYGLVRYKSEDSECCERSSLKELNTRAMKFQENVCFRKRLVFECFSTPHTITCSCANPFFIVLIIEQLNIKYYARTAKHRIQILLAR